MTHTLLSASAILFYLAATGVIGLAPVRPPRHPGSPSRDLALSLGFAGLILHTWLLYGQYFQPTGTQPGLLQCPGPHLLDRDHPAAGLQPDQAGGEPGSDPAPVAALTMALEASLRRSRLHAPGRELADSRSMSCSPCSPTAC